MNKLLENISLSILTMVIISIFFGGVLFCADQLSQSTQIRELFFWSAILLLFMGQINRGMKDILRHCSKRREAEQ